MYSVAQNREAVKWAEKKRAAVRMSKRFIGIGGKLFARGKRMEVCGELITSTVCPSCGQHGHTMTSLCRDRLCPVCAWRLSRARFAQMAKVLELIRPIVKDEKAICMLITLTVRNVPLYKLSGALKEMSAAWKRITMRVPFKSKQSPLIGFARNTEITINPKTREAHPHYHIMLLWKGAAKKQVEEWVKTLQEQWRTALNVDYAPIVDAREAYTKERHFDTEADATIAAALEASKYCVKDKQVAELSDAELVMFAQQIEGYRFASYGGLIKTVRKKLGLSDDSYDEIDNGTCPTCGTKMLQYVMTWSGSTYVLTEVKAVTE